jgi:hypothetical protein
MHTMKHTGRHSFRDRVRGSQRVRVAETNMQRCTDGDKDFVGQKETQGGTAKIQVCLHRGTQPEKPRVRDRNTV